MKQTPKFVRAAFAIAAAALCVLSTRADEVNLAWKLAPGDPSRPWLPASGNNERGMAYNPATGHLLVVSRSGSLSVRVLDAATGAHILNLDETEKVLNVTGVSGGTFPLSQIRCTSDGVIYGANLTTSTATPQFKIYRWDNEDAAPFVVYAANPGTATVVRWGDTFNIRGSGNNTQLIAGAGNAFGHAAVFTTADEGTTFASVLIDGVGEAAGMQGISFGQGNTIWAKRLAGPLRHVSFTLDPAAATLNSSFTVGAVGPIATSGKYLAGVTIETPDRGRVYDVSDVPNAPLQIGQDTFASDNANGNNAGAADFGGGRVYFLDANNGLLALNLIERTDPVTFPTPPANQFAFTSGTVTFNATASGTPPIRYQWYRVGVDGAPDTLLEGRTGTSLTLSNVTPADSGGYRIEATGPLGPVSATATLTVTDPPDAAYLTFDWQIKPTDGRPYILNDTNSRGLAYNPATGHLLVVSRTPAAAIHVLDAATGLDIMDGDVPRVMDLTGVTGGTFAINMIGVADDGRIYGANLTTDSASTAFKVYRWDNETAAPVVVYSGNPSNGATRSEDRRFGDTFDVRGSGATTEILATGRNGKVCAIIAPDADPLNFFATAINVAEAPDTSVGLGCAFADGNAFYATSPGYALRLITYPAPEVFVTFNVEGTVAKTFTSAEIPFGATHLDYDPATRLFAANFLENPDNVRLYRVAEDQTMTLLDVELLRGLDNNNGNGTGAVDFASNMLFSLNTQNGIIAFNLDPNPTQVIRATLSAPAMLANGFRFSFSGSPNTAYTVEGTTDFVTWSPVGTAVTTDASGNATVTDETTGGVSYRFYQVVKR